MNEKDEAEAVKVAQGNPLIARNQVALSWAITLMFGAMLGVLLWRGPPMADQFGGQIFLIAMGVLGAEFSKVLQFFYGNSTASSASNSITAQIATRASQAAPLGQLEALAENARRRLQPAEDSPAGPPQAGRGDA